MKEAILLLSKQVFILYYYILLIRFVFDLNSKWQKNDFYQTLLKITAPLTSILERFIPHQTWKDYTINLSLLIFLFLYQSLMNFILSLLQIILL